MPRNDHPTSLRRGYGFPEARAAGAPYVRPRSGYEMDWDVKDRHYEKELRALRKRDLSVEKLVLEKIEAMKSKENIYLRKMCFQMQGRRGSATLLYYFVLYDRPDLAPDGYWTYVQEQFGWEVPQLK